MKGKQLILLAGLAATLAALAVWSSRNDSQQNAVSGVGDTILPRLKGQLNDIATVSIQSPASTVTVTRIDGIWRLPSKWDYPANFDQIRQALNKLADIKTLQPIRTTPADRAEFQLLTPADSGSTNHSLCATRIQLLDASHKTLALLYLGKPHSRPGPAEAMDMGGYPDGRYVMTEEGQTSLITDVLQEFLEPDPAWLDKEFVAFTDIVSFQITGQPKGDVRAERTLPSGEFKLLGPCPATKEGDIQKLNQISSSLGYLRFEDVADPKLTPDKTGLDKPVVCRARTAKGELLTVRLGKSPAGDTKRYASISIAFEAPAYTAGSGTNQMADAKAHAEETAKTAAATKLLNEKLSSWIYLLDQYSADALAPGLDDVLKDKPKTEESKSEKK